MRGAPGATQSQATDAGTRLALRYRSAVFHLPANEQLPQTLRMQRLCSAIEPRPGHRHGLLTSHSPLPAPLVLRPLSSAGPPPTPAEMFDLLWNAALSPSKNVNPVCGLVNKCELGLIIGLTRFDPMALC